MCVGVPTLTPAPCTNPSASLALRSSLPAQPAVLPPHLLLPMAVGPPQLASVSFSLQVERAGLGTNERTQPSAD
jgi:hypothetical protein